jgi:hypothetical protein
VGEHVHDDFSSTDYADNSGFGVDEEAAPVTEPNNSSIVSSGKDGRFEQRGNPFLSA